jgi:hypothetical protein
MIHILQYLEGQDLYQVYQVSFLLKMTIDSVPALEITLLKFRMRKSNERIIQIKNSEAFSQQPTSYIPKFVQRPFVPYFPMANKANTLKKSQKPNPLSNIDLTEEKWVNFVESFKEYADRKGFEIIKKNEFDSKDAWKSYSVKYSTFYQEFVDHWKKSQFQNHQKMYADDFSSKLYFSIKGLVKSLQFNFHTMTNYRYFPNRAERKLKPPHTELLF